MSKPKSRASLYTTVLPRYNSRRFLEPTGIAAIALTVDNVSAMAEGGFRPSFGPPHAGLTVTTCEGRIDLSTSCDDKGLAQVDALIADLTALRAAMVQARDAWLALPPAPDK